MLAGHSAIVDVLMRHGAAAPVLSAADAFRADCLRADDTAVRTLLQGTIEGRDDVGTLLGAARHGRLRAVRLMLDVVGLSVDSADTEQMTALHLAAANGQRLVVDELLARGARLDIRDTVHGGTALGHATWCARHWPRPDREDVRAVLLEHATDVTDVAYAGARDRLETLLEEDPARAHTARPNGRTALHVLASGEVSEFEPLMDLLLAHGADIHARDRQGQTPLAIATAAMADEVAAALVARRREVTPSCIALADWGNHTERPLRRPVPDPTAAGGL